MKNNIHFFSKKEAIPRGEVWDKYGIRGRLAMEFAELNLPILPGFIIDSDVAAHLENEKLTDNLKANLKKCEQLTGKIFNDPSNPMLVKIVVSPNLAIVHYPTLHNFGLTDATIPGFNTFVGEDFGYHESLFLIRGYLEIEAKIAELEKKDDEVAALKKKIDALAKGMEQKKKAKDFAVLLDEYRKLLPQDFFSDAYVQLETALKRISRMLALDELDEDDVAIIIQPMVYGNYGKDSASGGFYTRNIITGEPGIEGYFERNKFNTMEATGSDINKLEKEFFSELTNIARIVEDHFKEIRSIRFTIENKRVWLIDQRPVMTKSTQADIRTLLDLHGRKKVDDTYLIQAIKPEQLNEILHPVINSASVKNMKAINGGISGAPGAAIGKVYFSTESLLEAHKAAQLSGTDTRLILCVTSSFAEDVKAIEVATGVLSSEGGYSAHASVVARQYGKVSLVKPELKVKGKKATIGDVTLNEGDYITLNVPHFGEPAIYIGKAELIEPDPKQSGLLDYIAIVKKHVNGFHVRVNADTPRDAELALKFGAEGIGLCRTEHMFFNEKRINVFREMIISNTKDMRIKALKKLKVMQKDDFYKLFKIMQGKEVTIRLLDAPLHEFLPHNDTEMKAFLTYMKSQKGNANITEKEIVAACDSLKEFNPMLGHRGCRIAVSYPEIYEMQVEAIMEAAYQLQKEKVDVRPEIMIPIVMNENELKLIIYGKKIEGYTYKGLYNTAAEVAAQLGVKPIPFKVGTMIELPVAALGAGEIARYAEFFSFGTNDLTQTTIGLSRDDYNSFMPDYTLFDIIAGNPFRDLNPYVKELIQTAVRRGTMTRPDLIKGLCGEHGAVPENIKFCMESGLDYVSCSVYSVPIANLAVAQFNVANAKA
ncbi:MAG TPA: PEP/pyruvate-binding domain-containing protein [Spirochaetia bacterium]|nr:PEP/pyruvate-binding domain-containing protein [Spirochaetia bacterium]